MEWNYLEWIFAIIGVVGFIKVLYQMYDEDVFRSIRRRNRHRNERRENSASANVRRNNVSAVVGSERQTVQRVTQPNIIGPMVYYATNAYGLNDSEYRFKYVKVGNAWRAYIKKMPDLRGRDSNGHTTHRYWDDNNQPYVCWDTPIMKLSEMQAVSKLWADNIQKYIATGQTFG